MGAVLYDPTDHQLLYPASAVPEDSVRTWLPKISYMGQLELLAAPFGLATWAKRLVDRPILLWIDNDRAAANLVEGYSPKTDSSSIVGSFWLMAAQLKASIYIDRVESESNLSDGPSRFEFDLIQSLGGVWGPPNFSSLTSPPIDPSKWFGAPFGGGEP